MAGSYTGLGFTCHEENMDNAMETWLAFGGNSVLVTPTLKIRILL